MSLETAFSADQVMNACSPTNPCASPSFGALKPKTPLKLRNAAVKRAFFDSADYQLAAIQAREAKEANATSQQQAIADWRALVKCSSQAAQASVATAHHASASSPFHLPQMATPGTQPLCRGVHRPSRLSQAGC